VEEGISRLEALGLRKNSMNREEELNSLFPSPLMGEGMGEGE